MEIESHSSWNKIKVQVGLPLTIATAAPLFLSRLEGWLATFCESNGNLFSFDDDVTTRLFYIGKTVCLVYIYFSSSSSYLSVDFMMWASKEKSQSSRPAVTRSAGRAVMEAGTQGGGGSAQSPLFGRRFGLGSWVIVNALGLEKDGVFGVSPKMRHRVTAMAATSDDLQPAAASPIRTRFACETEQKEIVVKQHSKVFKQKIPVGFTRVETNWEQSRTDASGRDNNGRTNGLPQKGASKEAPQTDGGERQHNKTEAINNPFYGSHTTSNQSRSGWGSY